MINFRDLGSMETTEGKKVIAKKLFRSGELCQLTSTETNYLENELQIRTIVDFRNEQERRDKPDEKLKNAHYVAIDLMASSKGKTSSFEDLLYDKNAAFSRMQAIYRDLILSKSSLLGYRQFFELLVEKGNAPFVFHCFAGKDRTGIAAAFILKMLAVSDDVIMEDYLKTNSERKQMNETIIEKVLAKSERFTRHDLEILLTVSPEFLTYANKIIEENFGNFDNYVEKGLKLPKSFRDEMKRLYVA